MDLRAAYDLVDRSRLWQRLATTYGFPPGSVRRLADMFDHNVSRLLVNGKQSKDLPNTWGVMQGSTLSPALFNFLIDEMAWELEKQPGTGVQVHGKLIKALLFADDTALVAPTELQLSKQLNISEKWS